MKVCEVCGKEIDGKDGDNFCVACDWAEDSKKRIRRMALRRERDLVMRSLGMVKVRGALGGTYWE